MTSFLFHKKRHKRKNLNPVQAYNIIRTLSKLGICSRKQAVSLVQSGRLQVNGQVIRDPGRKVKKTDQILLDGKPLQKKKKIYLMLYKPAGYITTREDEKNRKTVYDLLDCENWIFPVGRLDQDSEGLLLFTNDTAFSEEMTNPHHQVPRTYQVELQESISHEELEKIRQGIDIGRGERACPKKIRILRQTSPNTFLEIILREGKNREVRRIFEALGKKVYRLIRTQFGPFHLGSLQPGQWRYI